jgi:hypothetical protein
MQKTFLKLRAYKNDKPKGPKYSWKKFKLEQAITLEPGTYDIDIWENWGETKADDRGVKKEQPYLTVEIKEPWKKETDPVIDSMKAGVTDSFNTKDDLDDEIPF